MKSALALVLCGLLSTGDSLAQTPAADVAEEVVVYGDLFARWDGTRWFIETETVLPYTLSLTADENRSVRTQGYQLRAVLACEKDWKLGKLKFEVTCTIESMGIQSSHMYRSQDTRALENHQMVLEEIDRKLTGASVQLQVLSDGRVDNVDLEGLPQGNRRINRMQETLRTVLGRLMSGFHLKLRKHNQLHEGKWVEFNSTLLSMPGTQGMTPSHTSHLVHYLNRFEGQTLVQTIGRGMVSIPALSDSMGDRAASNGKVYQTDLIGVSIFDYDEGYMLERVWAVEGEATASNFFGDPGYWYAGRVRKLGDEEQADVGPTRPIAVRGKTDGDLPLWVPIER